MVALGLFLVLLLVLLLEERAFLSETLVAKARIRVAKQLALTVNQFTCNRERVSILLVIAFGINSCSIVGAFKTTRSIIGTFHSCWIFDKAVSRLCLIVEFHL